MLRVLEVRFHHLKKGHGPPVPVALLLFEDDRVEIRSLETIGTLSLDRQDVMRKLRFLIDMTAPQSFDRLCDLRSNFWSFVEVDAAQAARAGDA